ncbi:MAG: FAD-binding oxidoreductase, partial [Candidatus Binatia bacterium]
MSRIINELKALAAVHEGLDVKTDAGTLADKSHDWWVRGAMERRIGIDRSVSAVVRPSSTSEVSAVLSWAAETNTPVVPFGLGSGVCGAVAAGEGQIVLDTTGMSRIVELNETALTVTVQPGMRGADFEAELNARGYTMGHFPQSIDLSTVGGWCATRAAGQFSTLYGNIEDMLLGCEVVLADGEVVRVPPKTRSATGPDLKQLFLGSEGTLGVVTELVFRVHPLAEASRGSCYTVPTIEAGIEALRQILRAGWRPAVTRLHDAVEAGRNFNIHSEGEPVLLILSEGPEALVDVQERAVKKILAAHGGVDYGPEPMDSWLKHRNQVPELAALLEKGLVVDTIEVAVGWDKLAALFKAVTEEGSAMENMVAMSGHVSHCYTQGANIYFTFIVAETDGQKAIE